MGTDCACGVRVFAFSTELIEKEEEKKKNQH